MVPSATSASSRQVLGRTVVVAVALLALVAPTGASARDGDVLVAAPTGEPRALDDDWLGYNSGPLIRFGPRDDEDYTSAMAALRPGTIRYPGGTLANYWDWERGDAVCDGIADTYRLTDGGPRRQCDLPNGYQGIAPEGHGLEAYARELEATGADAVFVLNMLTRRPGQRGSNLADQVRMLETAEELDIEVERIELGNEFYLGDGQRDAKATDYERVFPNPVNYANRVTRWAPVLREAFPDARIAAVGAVGYGDVPRRTRWNDVVVPRVADVVDGLVLHSYTGYPDDVDGPVDAARMTAGPAWRDRVLRERFLPPVREAAPDLTLWFTEYNLFERERPVHGTWAHGLTSGLHTLSMLGLPDAEIVNFHSGLDSALFGALFRDEDGLRYGNDGFAGPTGPVPDTVPFAPTASGTVLGLLADALHDGRRAQPLDFGEATPTVFDGVPTLVAWQVEQRDGSTSAVAVNSSDTARTVDLSAAVRSGRAEVITAPVERRITGDPDDLTVTRPRVTGGRVVMPPWSVAHVRG